MFPGCWDYEDSGWIYMMVEESSICAKAAIWFPCCLFFFLIKGKYYPGAGWTTAETSHVGHMAQNSNLYPSYWLIQCWPRASKQPFLPFFWVDTLFSQSSLGPNIVDSEFLGSIHCWVSVPWVDTLLSRSSLGQNCVEASAKQLGVRQAVCCIHIMRKRKVAIIIICSS